MHASRITLNSPAAGTSRAACMLCAGKWRPYGRLRRFCDVAHASLFFYPSSFLSFSSSPSLTTRVPQSAYGSNQVRYCNARTAQEASDEVDLDELDLDAYEDMLLNAAMPNGEEGDMATSTTQSVAQPLFPSHSRTNLQEEVLSVLPEDGRAVKLTDLALFMNAEAVCETHGSVLAFLRYYPRLFACDMQMDPAGPQGSSGVKRWYVRRATPSASEVSSATQQCIVTTASYQNQPASTHGLSDPLRALDIGALYIEDELRSLRASATASLTTSSSSSSSSNNRRKDAAAAVNKRRLVPVRHGDNISSSSTAHSNDAHVSAQEVEILFSSLAHSGLPADHAVSIAECRAMLSAEQRALLTRSGRGLLRLLREEFSVACHNGVEVSRDLSLIGRAGCLKAAGIPVWEPDGFAAASTVSAKEDSANVPIDGTGEDEDFFTFEADAVMTTEAEEEPEEERMKAACSGDGGGVGTVPPEICSSDREVLYDFDEMRRGDSKVVAAGSATDFTSSPSDFVAGLNLHRLAHAPLPPSLTAKKIKEETPPWVSSSQSSTGADVTGQSSSSAKGIENKTTAKTTSTVTAEAKKTKSPTKRLPATPEELKAAHAAVAARRGWPSPDEMHDLFVECVPTFYVPISEVRTTDVLAKVLGPRNQLPQVLRIYSYFFDYDTEGRAVRLSAEVVHAEKGAANHYYPKWDPERTHAGRAGEGRIKPQRTEEEGGDETAPQHDLHNTQPAQRDRRLHHLQDSKVTRTFSTLRPTIPSRHTYPLRKAVAAKPRAEAAASFDNSAMKSAQLNLENPFSALSSSTSSSGGGGASVAEAEALALVRALAFTPYTHYVTLSRASHVCGLSTEEYTRALQHEGLRSLYMPFLVVPNTRVDAPHTNTIFADESIVRLRPYWLSPSSMPNLVGGNDILSTALLPSCVQRQLRPVWTSVRRLLQRLTSSDRHLVISSALQHCRRYTRLEGMQTEGKVAADREEKEEEVRAVAEYLRCFDECCWIEMSALSTDINSAVRTPEVRVRRYTGSADLDDMLHISIILVHHFATAEFAPLSTVLDVAEAALAHKYGAASSTPSPLLDMLRDSNYTVRLVAMLREHRKWVQVQKHEPCIDCSMVLVKRTTNLSKLGM